MFRSTVIAIFVAILPSLSLAKSSASCGPTPSGAIRPSAASGFQVQVVATGLSKPRGILLDQAGNLLVVESGRGVVSAHTLKEHRGCVSVGKSSDVTPALNLNHGIEMSSDGKTLYASSAQDVYSWAYDSSARAVSDRVNVVTNMSGTDHTTRTLLLSEKAPGLLVVTRGSTSNIDIAAASLDSGHSQVKAFNLTNRTNTAFDFSSDGLRLGWGLRNDVGIAEHPTSGGIWSVENSADQLTRMGVDIHEDNPAEELNFLGYLDGTEYAPQGGNFGYPWCFSAWSVKDLPDNGNLSVGSQYAVDASPDSNNQNKTDDYCSDQVPARLVFQAHMAPLDIKFNNSGQEAWITFHGSWDRTDPVGYKLSVVPFDKNGEPVDALQSTTAARDVLVNEDNSKCPDNCFRPVAMAFDSQGRIYLSSDASGEIYLITKASGASIPASPTSTASSSSSASATNLASSVRIPVLNEVGILSYDLDEMVFSPDAGSMDSSKSLFKRRLTASPSFEDSDSEGTDTGHSQDLHSTPSKRQETTHYGSGKLEELPNEVLNKIVSNLPSDHDFVNLMSTSSSFAAALAPKESAVWKERFLSLYDQAYVTSPKEYAWAYKLRRLVLKNFKAFTNPKDERLLVQLGVLKDMIIEAFLPIQAHVAAPLASRNLATLSSPANSPYMVTFLSSFLFPKVGSRYGQPDPLFDAIQLVFSYLILSPDSKIADVVHSSRDNYDITVVYNWGKSFSTLFRRVPEKAGLQSGRLRRNSMFPNLKSRRLITAPKVTYELDTHALLHIRNFWHRHLIESGGQASLTQVQMGLFGENTYAKMANGLSRAGITPKAWDKQLQDGLPDIATKWYGHWSCLHPWPKKKQALEEMQTCAEDWETADPLKLDLCTTTNNDEFGCWPPIFQAIPAFAKSIPESASCLFFRGVAPFVQISSSRIDKKVTSGSQSTLTVPVLHKYHPFLALRVRGLIHTIPSQPNEDGIPGWNRIVMVLYKPSKRYLIEVLENAEEEYGGPFGTAGTNQLVQAGQGQGAAAAIMDPAEIEHALGMYLEDKLVTNPLWRDPVRMNREVIEEIEEMFRLSEYLDWNDIDYAYAYEGVVLPGGKIMMGRWWRCGMLGEGDAMELDEEGIPVEEPEQNQDPTPPMTNDSGGSSSDDNFDAGTGNSGQQNQEQSSQASQATDATPAGSQMDVDVNMMDAGTDGLATGGTASNASSQSTTASNATNTGNISNAGNANPNPNVRPHRMLERGPFVFWC
ncbi:hypothetical protein ABEF95_006400 [Exophiala dermatitidis]